MSRARDERSALRAETTRLLHDLGGSADEVATELETAGVKGIPGSGTGSRSPATSTRSWARIPGWDPSR